MPTTHAVTVEALSHDLIAPFGWLLGEPDPLKTDRVGFWSQASDFWHEHLFDPGLGGETEVLWVEYRDNSPLVSKLEVHYLTQQAVVPLTNAIVQILCLSDANQSPDLATLRAVRLYPGVGICMRPGVWHTTRASDATCLMLTRSSTTADLVGHLVHARPARESTITDIPPIRLVDMDAT